MAGKAMNILIVGVGGQGTLLTSRILAQVAVDLGYDVKVSEIHGMAQRGGSVTAQIHYGRLVHSPLILEGQADGVSGNGYGVHQSDRDIHGVGATAEFSRVRDR